MTETTTAERPSLSDTLDSLTGYDEIAITKSFDRYFAVLCDDATMLSRALIFTLARRDGESDKNALKVAMSMPLGDVNDYFADDDEDVMPDSPDTPAGEDDSQLD